MVRKKIVFEDLFFRIFSYVFGFYNILEIFIISLEWRMVIAIEDTCLMGSNMAMAFGNRHLKISNLFILVDGKLEYGMAMA